jgi:hypothetical protein
MVFDAPVPLCDTENCREHGACDRASKLRLVLKADAPAPPAADGQGGAQPVRVRVGVRASGAQTYAWRTLEVGVAAWSVHSLDYAQDIGCLTAGGCAAPCTALRLETTQQDCGKPGARPRPRFAPPRPRFTPDPRANPAPRMIG